MIFQISDSIRAISLRLPNLICNLDPIKDAGRLISGACRRSAVLIKYFPSLVLDQFHD
jgi:hypothetical protein